MIDDYLKTIGGRIGIAAMLLTGVSLDARADAVVDWSVKAGEIVHEARLGAPPATRVMAIVQTAVADAVDSVAQRRDANEAVAAAVAAANRVTLAKLLPAHEAAVTAAYQAAIAAIPEGPAKAAGVTAGEAAASKVLAARADDGAVVPDRHKPHAVPGVYVPTASVAVPHWGQRKPWAMAHAAQFRPAPPPRFDSATWVRDYEEIKALGSKASTKRTAEQTEIARFWEYSLPPIYHGVVRSVARQPGRDVLRNAKLFAAVAQAMDDALIAVFDAKYTYNFWRPVTAIRNGELDGNDATEADPGWTPLIDTPMHPEYPSAHASLASAVATVLRADLGTQPTPELSTTSPSAKGITRRWTSLDAFVDEVAMARVYDGVHYRNSSQIGVELGRHAGMLAARKTLGAAF